MDFGCGRGRVVFYHPPAVSVPVVGIEPTIRPMKKRLSTSAATEEKARHIKAPIHLQDGLAELYVIKPQDCCFYFSIPSQQSV